MMLASFSNKKASLSCSSNNKTGFILISAQKYGTGAYFGGWLKLASIATRSLFILNSPFKSRAYIKILLEIQAKSFVWENTTCSLQDGWFMFRRLNFPSKLNQDKSGYY